MLYILLGIIAVGVLLASEEGKELLGAIQKVLLVIGGLYLAYWIIIFIIGFFTSSTGKIVADRITTILGYIFLIFMVSFYLYLAWKNRKKIPGKLKATWIHNWGKYPIWIIFIILAFGFSIIAIAWVLSRPG